MMPDERFIPGGGIDAVEFVDPVKHPRLEERGSALSEADVDPSERQDGRQAPEVREDAGGSIYHWPVSEGGTTIGVVGTQDRAHRAGKWRAADASGDLRGG
jgi:hypothetical protein